MAEHKSISGFGVLTQRDPIPISSPRDTSTAQHTAFIALYQEHLPRVYRYALSRTGSIADAQDITSQTFLAGFEHFKRYQGRSQVSTWLLGIAHHKVIDHLRKQQNHVSLDQVETASLSGLTVETSVEQSLDIQRVIRAMTALSADRCEALSLHLFGELTIQETADTMGRTYAAVQMLIQRGLTDLRTRLQEEK